MTDESARTLYKNALLFAVVGPLLGSLPFTVPMGLISFSDFTAIGFVQVALFGSYAIGFIPALVTGLIYTWRSPVLIKRFGMYPKAGTFVIGAGWGLAITLLLMWLYIAFTGGGNWRLQAYIAVCGMYSAGLCALLCRRWFKPEFKSSSAVDLQLDTVGVE